MCCGNQSSEGYLGGRRACEEQSALQCVHLSHLFLTNLVVCPEIRHIFCPSATRLVQFRVSHPRRADYAPTSTAWNLPITRSRRRHSSQLFAAQGEEKLTNASSCARETKTAFETGRVLNNRGGVSQVPLCGPLLVCFPPSCGGLTVCGGDHDH